MDWQKLLIALILLALSELAADFVTRTPLWLTRQCLAPYLRLWRENAHLHGILHNKRFTRWRPKTARYVALQAIKARGTSGRMADSKWQIADGREQMMAEGQAPRPVLDLLEGFLKRGEPVVLLGEPGAGKTTALEALTYRLARRAYRANVLLWAGVALVAALLILVEPLFSLLWLLSFALWEPFVGRVALPLFLEARSDYPGGDFQKWHEGISRGRLGVDSRSRRRGRVARLVDGVNEIQTGSYGTFVEGWRKLLQEQRPPAVIFTGRQGEDPAPPLGVKDVVSVCDLDDAGVRQFLQVYGREKAATERKPYPPGKNL